MSNQFLINPITENISFGEILDVTTRGVFIPAGQVRLLTGRHIGPNKGFGAAHIWSEHQLEMEDRGFAGINDVPAYVASIVAQGTPLFFSGDNMRHIRLVAVRSSRGTAVLEFKDRREGAIWSVVTAYSGTRTHGTRVGAVR